MLQLYQHATSHELEELEEGLLGYSPIMSQKIIIISFCTFKILITLQLLLLNMPQGGS